MGSGKAEPKLQLIGMAKRRAFESYMRFGRLPDSEHGSAECKALNPSLPLRSHCYPRQKARGLSRRCEHLP